ncbi:hypothetical protein LC087_04265 [Bacillus carboniphilus]|uniref:Uncharacterized protein n=1 Tax=Bacillus carboniphilus TaxID=86663 RepID=A0ABY9K0M3_9BACI|nr:hypothetical protein [Bacillus carboniphilus]WLR43400.1 hypothetical protein LC087_04265 [Bacillus carboniphilus]
MKFKNGCYLVYGFAPEGTNAIKANQQLNKWIAHQKLGKIIYHDHFANRPLGGIAIFELHSQTELDNLYQDLLKLESDLFGWTVNIHRLTHSNSTERFVFQTQYTLNQYRGVKMNYHFDTP